MFEDLTGYQLEGLDATLMQELRCLIVWKVCRVPIAHRPPAEAPTPPQSSRTRGHASPLTAGHPLPGAWRLSLTAWDFRRILVCETLHKVGAEV